MPRNTSEHYRHRPLPVALANLAGRIVPATSLVTLDPDSLIESATRRARETDFGPDGWRPGLERLCAALADEAQLNLVGRLAARNHLVQLLENRLHLEAARKADPAIGEQPVAAPIFITGLPRTGSTLLHGLMAQDADLRVPWTWEVMYPGNPPPGADPDSDNARVARTDASLRWVHRLAPGFRAIHPIAATLPQECIAITAHALASVEFMTTFGVPTYQRWLDDSPAISDRAPRTADATSTGPHYVAMGYHRRFVQHLQRHQSPRQWVFKAPAHLYSLDAILAVYPDARFVFTMRDAEAVVASIASHGATLACAFSDEVDIVALGHYWMHWWAEGFRRARRFRAAHAERFVDLHYDTLVADPVAATQSLYEQLSLTLAPEAQRRMQEFLYLNRQDRHGRHRYALDDFGITREEIVRAFEWD